MFKKTISYIICLLCLISINIYAAVKAEVDRDTIYLGESFQLTLHGGQSDAQTPPDIRVLQANFDILSSGQSSQVLISSGKSYTDTLWLFVLSPKHAGNIKIPSISIGNEKTKPITIHVKTNGQANNHNLQPDNRHVFMTSRIIPTSPYVQSQAMYKAIIYYDRNIENPKLSEPHAKNVTFIHLGNDKNYKKVIDGKPYQVYEVNFAMFPQQSGAIKINSPIFVGNVMNNTAGKYFSNMWQPFRISAEDVTLQVKSIPSNAQTNWWLPAKSVSLKDEWSSAPESFTLGTPITRTITIHGENVLANQLPQLMPTQVNGFQIYQDKAETKSTTDGKNIYAIRTEKAAFIPTKTGDYTIPAIKIHWWNTETNKAQVTTIPAKNVHVIASGDTSQSISKPPQALSTPIHVTKTTQSNITKVDKPLSASNTSPFWKDKWFWLANLILLLWIITLIFLWKNSDKIKVTTVKKQPDDKIASLRVTRNAIKHAAQEKNILEFKSNLIILANKTWPHHTCLSLGDVIDRIEDVEAIDALNLLDEQLYRQSEITVDLMALWKKIEKAFIVKKSKTTHEQLPKMY